MLFAGDIKADPVLQANLGTIGKGPQNSIQNLYAKLKQGFQQDSAARKTGPSDYFNSRVATSENFANQGLQDTLGGVLGGATYKDTLAGNDALANEALAREIGALNKPSTLEEILAGLGGASKTGVSLYQMLGKSKPRSGSTGSLPDLSNDFGNAGYEGSF